MFFISELVIDLTDNFKAREEIKPKVYKALAEENTFVCESDILALVDEGKKVIKAGTKLYLPIKTFFPERGLNIDSIETFQKKICVTLEPDIDARHYYIPKDSSLKKVESE